jgi:hypothetical protein
MLRFIDLEVLSGAKFFGVWWKFLSSFECWKFDEANVRGECQ